jgi:GntR family transcriptional regulator/MocR family aminotransferase
MATPAVLCNSAMLSRITLGRTRGVITDPDRIIIIQGAAQGFDLVLRVLKAAGKRAIAVEDPSHATQHERIRSSGLALVPAPVDAEGVVTERFNADAVLVTPAHQFPTGVVMSGERRRALLQKARRQQAMIIEDDYDAEFRYDREPVRSLQGLEPDSIVYLGTASKVLAPALRLGWLVLPSRWVDDFVRMKHLVDDFSPTLGQLTLAEMLRRGDYDRHIRRARSVYSRRRSALLRALEHELPALPVAGAAAGLHVLVRLPAGVNDAEVTRTAEDLGVRVAALSSLRIATHPIGGLVLGYGAIDEAKIPFAVNILAKAIALNSE